MTQNILTQKQLKEILNYDPVSGIFTWKNANGSAVYAGDVAGCVTVNGYIAIKINGKSHQAHRLAFLYVDGLLPAIEVDHINHNRSDNSFPNLRVVPRGANMKNKSLGKDNLSGVNGVSFCNTHNRWRAYINVNEKPKSLGSFADKFEAICCRKSADNKYGYHKNHGDNIL